VVGHDEKAAAIVDVGARAGHVSSQQLRREEGRERATLEESSFVRPFSSRLSPPLSSLLPFSNRARASSTFFLLADSDCALEQKLAATVEPPALLMRKSH